MFEAKPHISQQRPDKIEASAQMTIFVVQRQKQIACYAWSSAPIKTHQSILSEHFKKLPVPETHHEFLDPWVSENQVAHQEANQSSIELLAMSARIVCVEAQINVNQDLRCNKRVHTSVISNKEKQTMQSQSICRQTQNQLDLRLEPRA